MRPDADAIAALAMAAGQDGPPFAVTHRPEAAARWLELLVHGLGFDCRGLPPGESAGLPERGTLLGLADLPRGSEAIELVPGPHIADAGAMLPVVRAQAALGLRLAELPGVEAVCWLPARTWMEPGYFRKAIAGWLAGGAFPALGLTALEARPEGGFRSVGLGFLIGQELQLEPGVGATPAGAARIAVRLVHELVSGGAVSTPLDLTGPDGERLHAAPASGGSVLRVSSAS